MEPWEAFALIAGSVATVVFKAWARSKLPRGREVSIVESEVMRDPSMKCVVCSKVAGPFDKVEVLDTRSLRVLFVVHGPEAHCYRKYLEAPERYASPVRR